MGRVILLTIGLLGCSSSPPPAGLIALAPTHLEPVVGPLADLWFARSGEPIRIHYDSPNRIARQIDSGTPTDLFFSGDTSWMDRLRDGGHIQDGARIALGVDELVVVGSTPGHTGDGLQRLRASTGRVHIPNAELPPGPAAARLVADVLGADASGRVYTEEDESAVLAALAVLGPGELGIVRESLLLLEAVELAHFPLRGRMDVASTIEVAPLSGERAEAQSAAFLRFVAEEPGALSHFRALKLGMPNAHGGTKHHGQQPTGPATTGPGVLGHPAHRPDGPGHDDPGRDAPGAALQPMPTQPVPAR